MRLGRSTGDHRFRTGSGGNAHCSHPGHAQTAFRRRRSLATSRSSSFALACHLCIMRHPALEVSRGPFLSRADRGQSFSVACDLKISIKHATQMAATRPIHRLLKSGIFPLSHGHLSKSPIPSPTGSTELDIESHRRSRRLWRWRAPSGLHSEHSVNNARIHNRPAVYRPSTPQRY